MQGNRAIKIKMLKKMDKKREVISLYGTAGVGASIEGKSGGANDNSPPQHGRGNDLLSLKLFSLAL